MKVNRRMETVCEVLRYIYDLTNKVDTGEKEKIQQALEKAYIMCKKMNRKLMINNMFEPEEFDEVKFIKQLKRVKD
jgi:hypothetical protein